jgi:Family of unknown function (DUF6526)
MADATSALHVATQSYTNHPHRPTGWLIALALAFTGEVFLLWGAITGPLTVTGVGLVFVGGAVVLTILLLRRFALRLQDRIIRSEMDARLTRLGRGADLARLSVAHLVALRFASDTELPGLIDRALAERLTPDQIKRAVTDWQADLLRT